MKKYIILALLGLFFAVNMSFNSSWNTKDFIKTNKYKILKQLPDKQIYHIESPEDMGGWTCGFFALRNALDLEQRLGISAKDVNFKKECNKYLKKNKVDPFDGITSDDVLFLADDYLKLHNVYCIRANDEGNMQPIMVKTDIYYEFAEDYDSVNFYTEVTKNNILIEAMAPKNYDQDKLKKETSDKKRDELRKLLENLKDESIIHFVCCIEDKKHWILVSVVKKADEKVLFVFDNMNENIDKNKYTKKFINEIHKLYC